MEEGQVARRGEQVVRGQQQHGGERVDLVLRRRSRHALPCDAFGAEVTSLSVDEP